MVSFDMCDQLHILCGIISIHFKSSEEYLKRLALNTVQDFFEITDFEDEWMKTYIHRISITNISTIQFNLDVLYLSISELKDGINELVNKYLVECCVEKEEAWHEITNITIDIDFDNIDKGKVQPIVLETASIFDSEALVLWNKLKFAETEDDILYLDAGELESYKHYHGTLTREDYKDSLGDRELGVYIAGSTTVYGLLGTDIQFYKLSLLQSRLLTTFYNWCRQCEKQFKKGFKLNKPVYVYVLAHENSADRIRANYDMDWRELLEANQVYCYIGSAEKEKFDNKVSEALHVLSIPKE